MKFIAYYIIPVIVSMFVAPHIVGDLGDFYLRRWQRKRNEARQLREQEERWAAGRNGNLF